MRTDDAAPPACTPEPARPETEQTEPRRRWPCERESKRGVLAEVALPRYGDKGAVVPFKARPGVGRRRTGTRAVAERCLKVLVIAGAEDRMAVRIALEAGGFALQEAADAAHGLMLAAASTPGYGPDCILLGDLLPDGDGLEVLKSMGAQSPGAGSPNEPGGDLPCAVVMLTDAGAVDAATAAIKAGALDHVVKDHLDSYTLRRAIRAAVEQFRLIEAKRAAERRNAQLAALVDATDDAIIGLGTDLVVQTWNAGAQRMFGYGEAEAVGMPVADMIIPTAFAEELATSYDAVMSGRSVLKMSERRHKDGHAVPVEISVAPIIDGGGGIIGMSVVMRDISERKRTEARLAEREAQLALFVEHAPAAIAMLDTGMRYLAVSRRYLSDYAVPEDVDIIGLSHYEVFPEVPAHWREIHARVLAGEELTRDEEPFVRLDGHTDWCRSSMKPWRTPGGEIGGALLFSEVVTAQVEARRALAASEERYRAIFENAGVGIAHLGSDMKWRRVNNALCRILGYPRDEFITLSLEDISHPDDVAAEYIEIKLILEGRKDSYEMDKRFLRKDGALVWGRLTMGCVRKSDRSLDYFVGVLEDITWRKHTEEELRKSEERFRTSILHSPLPIMLYDDQEQVLAVSGSWLEASGYSREELRTIEEWTAHAYRERKGQLLERLRWIISTGPSGLASEHVIYTKDGRERHWSFSTSGLGTQSDGRRLFLSVAQDVTERKVHEEQVQLLMREINHRSKNMLSLVQAIARQTAARAPEDFMRCFTERIQALAANQDLLVRNEWRGVDVEDLVRAQLAHFADLVGSRIEVAGPKLRLNAAAAQAIGLALHELATNAGKYGALSMDSGHVDVRWQLTSDGFAISWTERNGPPVLPPERRGFGSTVISSMAKLSVGGEVALDYARAGLRWCLTCPAANALEAR
jgi:PAS domain S-box-containing protein